MHLTSNQQVGRVELTVVTSRKPVTLSKAFHLDGSTLEKRAGGMLMEGTAEKRALSPVEFRDLLKTLGPAQALVYGVNKHDQARIVAQDRLEVALKTSKVTVIARDRAHFTWPSGPGILMLDYDPPKDSRPLGRKELLETLYNAWPALRTAPHIWTASASSCIYRDTGEELRGIAGQRVYVFLASATDIPKAGETLYQRLWLAGHGRYVVSKSGSFLDRTIIDGAVWQPERLDFAGGAKCGHGIEQRRPDPILCNAKAPFLDISSLQELSPEEHATLYKLKGEARKAAEPAAQEARASWVEERLANVPEGDRQARRESLVAAIEHGRLLADFTLVSAKHGPVTVGEVLDNPSKYHNTRFADPLEPDYGNDPRIAVANLRAAGKPYIFSHAHGGRRFTLHRALQTIRIEGGELPGITAKALELMRLDGKVFDRDGELVRLDQGQAFTVSAPWLLFYLTGLARFEKRDMRAKKTLPADCPERLAKTVLALAGAWNLPQLAGIVTAPTMTAEGRIIETDGHDAGTGLYLDFGDFSNWPGIPEAPTADQARDAVQTLWHPFRDFPFETAADRAGYLAALLTAAVRQTLPTAPGFLIDSPTSGSGKTFLAKCLAVLVGSDAGVIPPNTDEADMRKMLLALTRTCPRVVTIDNVSGTFKSEALCNFLTATHFKDRVLGISEMVTGRTNCLFIVTGNNVAVVGDLNRRLVRCRINPLCEKPWLRTFDLDPVEHVREHRLDMVQSALTILKASVVSGFRHDGGRLASFELWSDFVRNAVVWVGRQGWLEVSDPVDSIETAFELDPDSQKLATLLCAWLETFGSDRARVADAIRSAESVEKPNINLRDALVEIAGEGGKVNPRRLGRWIEAHAGRIVNVPDGEKRVGLRFERNGLFRGTVFWRVRTSEGFTGFEGFLYTNAENCQKNNNDNSREHAGQPPQNRHNPHACCAVCINFSPNRLNPQSGPGTCETPCDGRFSKAPEDGADCPRFEQVTH